MNQAKTLAVCGITKLSIRSDLWKNLQIHASGAFAACRWGFASFGLAFREPVTLVLALALLWGSLASFETNLFLLGELIMPSRHEISCINKTDRPNPHERILSIGGRNPDGTAWKVSQSEAIQGIESQKWDFFVHRQGFEVGVIVAVSRYGHKYLKTRPDGEQPDNLLNLPECR